MDIKQSPRAIHLFAGAGGGILGGLLCGWRTVCAVEIDEFCREVLVARQNDGTLAPFPIWDDVRTFDGNVWRGCCDILCGGFPCQNCSPLGNREGIRGEKSGLWKEFARIIGEVQPEEVFVENSSDLIKLGLDVILRDLASLGYDAQWTCFSAAELGAPHVRDRLWLLAKKQPSGLRGESETPERDSMAVGRQAGRASSGEEVHVPADTDIQRCQMHRDATHVAEELHTLEHACKDHRRQPVELRWWTYEPGFRRVVDGVADHVDRLKALGNGQVAYVAARAYAELKLRYIEKD